MCVLQHTCVRGPGAFPHEAQLRQALAREAHRAGVTCGRCSSPLHHTHMPRFTAPKGPWGYDHVPWLDARARALAATGSCAYHRLLDKVRRTGPRDLTASHGRDLARKKELHTRLAWAHGDHCTACGRTRDPEFPGLGFELNHRVCVREGGDKRYNVSDFWISWGEVQGGKPGSSSARNRVALDMPWSLAEPAMRREAAMCELLCRSCHARVTQDQNNTSYDWPVLEAWLAERVARGVVREHAESVVSGRSWPAVLHITL